MTTRTTEEERLVEDGGLPPSDFSRQIERIGEIARYPLHVPADLDARLRKAAEHLLVDVDTLRAAATALCTGHLVLQGPPGTGKSSLTQALCRAFGVEASMVTAHEGWSPYEVIGRQELRAENGAEEIVPVDGVFTDAVVRCANRIRAHFDDPVAPQATWLVIDEINRAHIDRAFGELFTILGTDARVPVRLGHRPTGDRMLVLPARFRVIATANATDKQFVNNLSQGLRRRFAFVTVDVPPRRGDGEAWGGDASLATREFRVVCERAVERVAGQDEDPAAAAEASRQQLETARPLLEQLFALVERCRYSSSEHLVPFVPVGTAVLIDVVELFLTRLRHGLGAPDAGEALDWAASVKLAPLFDVDAVRPDALEAFADGLPPPFDRATRRELKLIVAAGASYVAR